jgi:hypothetical protein
VSPLILLGMTMRLASRIPARRALAVDLSIALEVE